MLITANQLLSELGEVFPDQAITLRPAPDLDDTQSSRRGNSRGGVHSS
jgi:hypothetical protein